ncbi:GPI-anchor transamidase subunit U [Acrasis kona]|uniref:GPI-anchor transamidase subunit U n=1 Tax=Acrasis kona TaxID=1008807 RepID=A0AAW2Z0F8_9EUKA
MSKTRWLLLGALAVSIRVTLFALEFDKTFSNMVEFTTPTTSFKRLKEALHLTDLGMSPYSSSVFIQPPLTLLPFSLPKVYAPSQTYITEQLWPRALFILLDLLMAYLLCRIGALTYKLKILDRIPTAESYYKNLQTLLPAVYLFNPVLIASCVSMSTVIFNNLAIAIMIYYALRNNVILSTLGLSLACYLTVYPLVLLIPLIVMFHQIADVHAGKNVGVNKSIIVKVILWSVIWQGLLQYMSFTIMGRSWEFLQQAYVYALSVADLTPNWGNFWYFFIEVFDHFRQFFLLMFNIHMLSYIAPLCIRFRRDGLFISVIMIAITSLFKAYPTFGDFFFYITLFAMYIPLSVHMRYGFSIVVLMLFTMLVGPAFFIAWVQKGTGNANFFYFVTLAFLMSQVLLIVEFVFAKLKHNYNLKKGVVEVTKEHSE